MPKFFLEKFFDDSFIAEGESSVGEAVEEVRRGLRGSWNDDSLLQRGRRHEGISLYYNVFAIVPIVP